MSFIHQCLIFDSHPAELLPQFCFLLFAISIRMSLCHVSGNKLEGDWGEIVALGAEISP